MPYSKRRESCTNKSGEKGTFVTIKKDGGKRQCWKSEKAFNNAQKARHAAAASESHHVEEALRYIIREMILLEKSGKKKKKKKKSRGSHPDESCDDATVKSLHLDKPFSVGGWPKGKHQGWVKGPPVNVQIKNYFKEMGLL